MTVVIPNCLKYDPNDATQCLECDHYLHFGKVTGRCECVVGSGTTCDPGFSCSADYNTCITTNQCLHITNCQECKYTDHSVCYKCASGYFPTPDGQSCVTLSTCKSIKKCKACNLTYPDQCQTCQSQLTPSADGKLCECTEGSGSYCPTGFTCSPQTRQCDEKDICRKNIENCKSCVYADHTQCYACCDGFSLEKGQCVKVDECMATSPHCSECDPKEPKNCLKCKNGLTVSKDMTTCECTIGSKQGCHTDQLCSQHYHICVEQMACLSFPSLIKGCSHCSYSDPRFCFKCDEGMTLSTDRLSCVDDKACESIYGCNKCNTIQPNLCFKCEQSLTLSSNGLSCFCGVEGQMCKNGASCISGDCQIITQNKTSSGQVAGIVVVVIILITVIIGLGVVLILQKRKQNQKFEPARDNLSQRIY